MNKPLRVDERYLLDTMRHGVRVLVRATTGRASHRYNPDCTDALLGLFKRKLVEIESVDKQAGWVIYKAKDEHR